MEEVTRADGATTARANRTWQVSAVTNSLNETTSDDDDDDEDMDNSL